MPISVSSASRSVPSRVPSRVNLNSIPKASPIPSVQGRLIKTSSTPSTTVRCVCTSTKDVGHMIECENCFLWSHSKCVGIISSVAKKFPYICPFCIRFLFSEISNLRSEIKDLRDKCSSFTRNGQTSQNSLCEISPKLESITSHVTQPSSSVSSPPTVNPLCSSSPSPAAFVSTSASLSPAPPPMAKCSSRTVCKVWLVSYGLKHAHRLLSLQHFVHTLWNHAITFQQCNI